MSPSVLVEQNCSESINSVAAAPSKKASIITDLPLPNISLQVTADHNLKQVETHVSSPKEGEVLLHVKATGICGYAGPLSTRSRTDHILMIYLTDPTFISGKQAA